MRRISGRILSFHLQPPSHSAETGNPSEPIGARKAGCDPCVAPEGGVVPSAAPETDPCGPGAESGALNFPVIAVALD